MTQKIACALAIYAYGQPSAVVLKRAGTSKVRVWNVNTHKTALSEAALVKDGTSETSWNV